MIGAMGRINPPLIDTQTQIKKHNITSQYGRKIIYKCIHVSHLEKGYLSIILLISCAWT